MLINSDTLKEIPIVFIAKFGHLIDRKELSKQRFLKKKVGDDNLFMLVY